MPPSPRVLIVAMTLWGTAFAVQGAPIPPASFVNYDDAPPPPPPPPASPITDHLALNAGFFWGDVRTNAQIDSGAGVAGTPLNAEQVLGVTHEAYQPQLELIFRLEDRNKVRVDWFDLRRNGSSTLGQTLQFGDQTFLAGEPLQSMLSWRQMDITYTYSFLRKEHFELGAGLGLHLLETEARAQVPGTPQYSDYSEAGPFATVAIDGTWLMAKRWSLNAHGQYMRVTVNDFTGELEDFHGDVQYRWRRNLAIGAGYDYTLREVDAQNKDPSGMLQLRVTGPQLFVRVSY